jgi:DNA replication initiation complex subunit (GINS family)
MDDEILEDEEVVLLALSSPDVGVLTAANATVRIQDNDSKRGLPPSTCYPTHVD